MAPGAMRCGSKCTARAIAARNRSARRPNLRGSSALAIFRSQRDAVVAMVARGEMQRIRALGHKPCAIMIYEPDPCAMWGGVGRGRGVGWGVLVWQAISSSQTSYPMIVFTATAITSRIHTSSTSVDLSECLAIHLTQPCQQTQSCAKPYQFIVSQTNCSDAKRCAHPSI